MRRARPIIYRLRAPDAEQPFYIGQSARIGNRFADHMKCRREAPTAATIRALLARNRVPILEIIGRARDRDDATRIEHAAIVAALAEGAPLVNSASEIAAARLHAATRKEPQT